MCLMLIGFIHVSAAAAAKFYKEAAMVEEVYTGFLHKSPGQPALLKTFVRLILHFNLKFIYLQFVKDSFSVHET